MWAPIETHLWASMLENVLQVSLKRKLQNSKPNILTPVCNIALSILDATHRITCRSTARAWTAGAAAAKGRYPNVCSWNGAAGVSAKGTNADERAKINIPASGHRPLQRRGECTCSIVATPACALRCEFIVGGQSKTTRTRIVYSAYPLP